MPHLLQLAIVVSALGLALIPFGMSPGEGAARWLTAVLALPLTMVICPLLAGMIAWPNRSFIQAGRFKRTASDPVYGRRRFHAACWTLLYYSPLYPFIVGWPWLRTAVFRLFGYRGAMDFTLYPDTWIRDLPILSIGSGAYLANKSTIGSNLVLADGTLLVAPITIGDKAIIGHLVMIAAGSRFGTGCQALHGAAIGLHTQMGAASVVEATSCLDHYSTIGNGVVLGSMSYIGRGAHVSDGLRIPAGTFIKAKTRLRTQPEVDALLSTETQRLAALRNQLTASLAFGGDL